jgi:hypothetical protein
MEKRTCSSLIVFTAPAVSCKAGDESKDCGQLETWNYNRMIYLI